MDRRKFLKIIGSIIPAFAAASIGGGAMGSYEYLLKDKPDDLKVKDDGTMEFSNSFMDDVKNHKPGERNERLLKISRAAGTGVRSTKSRNSGA